jgi:murein DD-endopeptidase MepM/ murein hydrolase activator NlpD
MAMETPIISTGAASALTCPSCHGPVDVKSRHVAVTGSAVRVYCSEDCLQGWHTDPIILSEEPDAPVHRFRWPRVLAIGIGLSLLVVDRGEDVPGSGVLSAGGRVASAAAAVVPALAPRAPDTDEAAREAARRAEREQEAKWTAELMQDAWFHPLAGPRRRMPTNHTQAFGAERPGDRPAQCLSGHCGVDVGGGLWGEPVHAVHDGVVDRVNRGPNEDHGGVYVRLAHRDGTVFTQYFHLAAVPRWVQPGARVEAGQIIGIVGDTGVKKSAPHLHFTISVRPSRDAFERYLDPEPLIAIWPLWLPAEEGPGVSGVSTNAPAGVPVRVRQPKKRAAPAPAPAGAAPEVVPLPPEASAPPQLQAP